MEIQWSKVGKSVTIDTTGKSRRCGAVKGEYKHSVDAKGRLAIPAKLREELGESFTVTKGLDGCLAIYPEREWEGLEERIRALPMSKSRDLQRFFFSAAFDAELDAQGRILLPGNLREFAGLTKEVTIIGASNHAEIWDSGKWTDYNEGITDDRVMAAMEELGF